MVLEAGEVGVNLIFYLDLGLGVVRIARGVNTQKEVVNRSASAAGGAETWARNKM